MLDRQITQTFVELADTLVVGFDIIEILQTLTERCVDLLDVDAAGILLVDARGTLQMVAASTEQARLLELFQIQDEDGPCLDCFRTGEQVACADLTTEPQRWPRFAAVARERGFAAVQAVPLRLRDQVIGAMNLFRAAAGAIPADTIAVAQSFADVATIGILNMRALARSEQVAEQLQIALTSRIVIEQAKGALAERRKVEVSEAFTLLRSYARSHSRPLTEVARAVINRDPSVADLTLRTPR
jgi:GAF domain-containing protein